MSWPVNKYKLKELEEETISRIKKIPLRLKVYRQALELNQADLADKTGIAAIRISKFEKGIVYPDIFELMLLSKHLKATADSILGLSDTVQRIHVRQNWFDRFDKRRDESERAKTIRKYYQKIEEENETKK